MTNMQGRRHRRRMAAAFVLAAMAAAATATLDAQRGGYRAPSTQSYTGNVRYDGRFVFVRMSYPWFGRGEATWAHDYPTGEYNFMNIFTTISNVSGHLNASSIMSFDDEEMFKFPVIYMVEPGCWTMTDPQVTALRAYLQKGGFLVVDDFPRSTRGCAAYTWGHFEVEMARAFPEGRWIELDGSHPIFDSFFRIDPTTVPMPYLGLGDKPEYWALFEDNDPKKRMLVIANYQNDLSEYWEWSASDRFIVADSNEAYKVAINQFVFGLVR
jgi:hypothetical protein